MVLCFNNFQIFPRYRVRTCTKFALSRLKNLLVSVTKYCDWRNDERSVSVSYTYFQKSWQIFALESLVVEESYQANI